MGAYNKEMAESPTVTEEDRKREGEVLDTLRLHELEEEESLLLKLFRDRDAVLETINTAANSTKQEGLDHVRVLVLGVARGSQRKAEELAELPGVDVR